MAFELPPLPFDYEALFSRRLSVSESNGLDRMMRVPLVVLQSNFTVGSELDAFLLQERSLPVV